MRLAIACFVALSVPCFAASPTSQYIFGSQADQSAPNFGNSWIGLMPRDDDNVWANSPDTGTSYTLMPTTGTFSTFCVDLGTAPGSGASWTYALYKNGSDQAITVTISGAQTQACDLVDTTGFVPGDLVALHVAPSHNPSPPLTSSSWYIVQTPQIPGETILFGSQKDGNTGSTQWLSLAGNSISTVTVEPAAATIIPAGGKITKFVAMYVGTGSPSTAVLDQNELPTSFSALMSTSGELFQVPGNLSVSAGDVFDVSETGISDTTAVYASVVFVPDVAGEFVIPTSRNTVSNSATAFYLPFTGKSNGTLESVELSAQQIADNLQIQGIYVLSSVAPGSGAQYAFTLRDNSANTTLSTTLSGTSLSACTTSAPVSGCSSGAAVAVNNLDLLDTAVVATGSPANTGNVGIAVSYLAYVPQLAFVPPPPAAWTTGATLGPLEVQLQDADGNPITGSTAPVTISSTPSGVSGTLTENAVNGVATFSDLAFSAFGTYTLTASASGLSAFTSSSIFIPSGPANKLVIATEPPATGSAGTALSPVVVQVEDVNGNVVAASSAPVTITSTPAGVGGTLTVNAVNGVATFSNLVFNALGSYTLTASASGLPAVTSSSISIGPGAASKLVYTTEPPASGMEGTAFGAVVQIEDAGGNLISTSTAAVTISSTPAGVSGTLTVNAVNGVATFSNLDFTTSGTYTLSASATGLSGATSTSISVAAPFTVTATAVSLAPGATTGNTSTITVTPANGFTGSVTLTAAVTASPAGAAYPPTFSFGATSPLNITGAAAGTGTLTISTTAATSAALALPNRPGVPWYAASGVAFACLVLFGIPARRRNWRSMLGMLALLFTLAGGLIACGGHGSGGGGGGGGYRSGGGGGAGSWSTSGIGGGGGGGGGSSYVEPSAINVKNTRGGGTSGNGQITISW